MADPATCGPVPADVRKRSLKVPVRSAERHLLYCLVQNQVLSKASPLHHYHKLQNYGQELSDSQLGPIHKRGLNDCSEHYFNEKAWLQVCLSKTELLPAAEAAVWTRPCSHPIITLILVERALKYIIQGGVLYFFFLNNTREIKNVNCLMISNDLFIYDSPTALLDGLNCLHCNPSIDGTKNTGAVLVFKHFF